MGTVPMDLSGADYESVVLRRITEYTFEPFGALLTAQRTVGTVIITTVADLREAADFGFRGVEDTSKFVGEQVFAGFPPGVPRSYLAWAAPAVFVPAGLGCDVPAVVDRLRATTAANPLELAPGRRVTLGLAAGTAHHRGTDAAATLAAALAAVDRDLWERFHVDRPLDPMPADWLPRFPADYLP